MHAIKGGWVGQTFALAANNDSGRKSRIRRSKEERKKMVETFIKKYQTKNDGNFPSLNLTHKEVGGSFYTVREIVREIIQENRVLAPPIVSLEEHDRNLFLEQHPLGSISLDPQGTQSLPDSINVLSHVANEYETENARQIFSAGGWLPEADHLGSENRKIINGQGQVAENDTGSVRSGIGHPILNHHSDTSMEELSVYDEPLDQHKIQESDNEKNIDDVEVLMEKPYPVKQQMTTSSIQHHDNEDSVIQSIEDDEYNNQNDQMVDKAEEFDRRIYRESISLKIPDKQEAEADVLEASEAEISHITSNIVVETFPIRPVPGTIIDLDGESCKSLTTAGILEDEILQHDKMSSVPNGSSKLVYMKNGQKLLVSTAQGKVVQDLQESTLETPILSPTSENKASDAKELEYKESLAVGAADGHSSEQLISKGSHAADKKSFDQDIDSLPKESHPTLDRINLDTWERASKKPNQPESNPLLALVKACISAFMKFWTE